MPFSLFSLLNPAPSEEPAPEQPPSSSSPAETGRRNSLPPIQYVQLPEHPHVRFSPPRQESQPQHSYAPTQPQDSIPAIGPHVHTHHGGYPAQEYGHSGVQLPQSPDAQRPGSSGGYGGNAPFALPTPNSTGGRKLSSPTLDQYHVASRTPEQRRPSMAQPHEAAFTLPPIHHSGQEQGIAGADSAPRAIAREENADATITQASHARHHDTGADHVHIESVLPHVQMASPTLALPPSISHAPDHVDARAASPTEVKQEAVDTPPVSSPLEARRASIAEQGADQTTLKPIATLKTEGNIRNPSPLRESSVPMPSTEDTQPAATKEKMTKKRPAAARAKKGTASVSKKAPPTKKRKVELPRSETPSSRASKSAGLQKTSSIGTPAESSPAPSTRSYSQEPGSEAFDEDDDDGPAGSDDGVYCICRKPDTGTFMIGCDGKCDDWYHGKCVGVEEKNKHLIEKYFCPICAKAGVGRTTWKRLCRRVGCRQPAKVGKAKGGAGGSKYCSEECGVAFFREMLARSRGRENSVRTRRKSLGSHKGIASGEEDLGAKGGVLSAGEVKVLLGSSTTAGDFRRLGEDLLSPPATPDGKLANGSGPERNDLGHTESEAAALERIRSQKEDARHRHGLLKDRMKFVALAKAAAARTAEEKGAKPKEYCGYDPRLEWTEAEFSKWRNCPAGKQAFELETLQVNTANGVMEIDADEDLDGRPVEICDRKKCARHLEWSKLATDDLRFEMSDNGDTMRALEREEREIKQRASLRGHLGDVTGDGSVEVHEPSVVAARPTANGGAMEIDDVKTEAAADTTGALGAGDEERAATAMDVVTSA